MRIIGPKAKRHLSGCARTCPGRRIPGHTPRGSRLPPVAALILAASAGAAGAQNADLAKQLANPIASLISVPLQLNYDRGYGPENGHRWVLNIQPVIPISLNEDWNLISRTILPVISQQDVVAGEGSQFGLGDIVQSLFFSPKNTPNGITWGVGPAFLLPSATDATLGGEKWGLGPTAVVLKQQGGWTYGGLANHIWSVAGDDERADVSSTFLQPFVSYTTATATTFFANTEATYDWKTEQWAVPINIGVNHLTSLGRQKIQIGGGVRYWMDAPEGGAKGWGARFNLVFLFPKA